MENGKAAIALNLKNNLGFGSTEFHVLRPSEIVVAEYIFYFIRRPEFRRLAKANFTGTAGQQRVPTNFLERTLIPLPSLAEQRRMVDMLNRVGGIRRLHREAMERSDHLLATLMARFFEG
jgi:type I restriction enzyme S subunit